MHSNIEHMEPFHSFLFEEIPSIKIIENREAIHFLVDYFVASDTLHTDSYHTRYASSPRGRPNNKELAQLDEYNDLRLPEYDGYQCIYLVHDVLATIFFAAISHPRT